MAHDQGAMPSQVSGVYWIEAKVPEGKSARTHRSRWFLDHDDQRR